MASSNLGRKLNPHRSLREPLGVKGVRQPVVITNNPSNIDQNQQLLVCRTVVQNLGRAIVKKLTIKISGNEVMSIDDSDVFHCYNDLWKTAPERAKGHYQGIDASENRIQVESMSVPEAEMHALPLTRPSLHSTSSCSRATCHFTRAHWATGSSTSSLLTTTAV